VCEPRIEDYLDHVCAPLVGVVPYARRMELRTELREHLVAFVATHEELGSSRDVAILMALRQFGPPRELARLWAREWKQGAAPARLEPAWRAMAVGLGCFGLASVLTLTVHMYIAARHGQDVEILALLEMILVGGVLPLSAGLVTGLLARARHALGSFYAVSALIVPAAALALSSFARYPGDTDLSESSLILAMVQALYWMPIGCGAAALGGSLRARLTQRPSRWVLQ
jgi:hypothetical protein